MEKHTPGGGERARKGEFSCGPPPSPSPALGAHGRGIVFCGRLPPSTSRVSAFNFISEQWNSSTAQWAYRAGPFATQGSQTLISLDQLGYTPDESAVLLRVKVAR